MIRIPTIMRSALAAIGGLLIALPLHAQQLDTKLRPLKAIRTPKNAAWTVRFIYREAGREEAGDTALERMKTLRVRKQENAYFETAIYQNGKKEERLVLDRIQFKTTPSGSGMMRLLPSDSQASDYSQTDFPELFWIEGRKPLPVVVNGTRLLLVEINSTDRTFTRREQRFKDEFERFFKAYGKLMDPATENAEPPALLETATANGAGEKLRLFLHPVTLLPIRFESPEGVRDYLFQQDPPAIQVPEQFRKVYMEWQNEIASSARPESQP